MSDAGAAAAGMSNDQLLSAIRKREAYFEQRVLGDEDWADADLRAYRSRSMQLRLAAVNRGLLEPLPSLYRNIHGCGPRSRY